MCQEILKFTKTSGKSQEKWSWYQYEGLISNWLPLRRLVPGINHVNPACLSTSWKTSFNPQLASQFGIAENVSIAFGFVYTYVFTYVAIKRNKLRPCFSYILFSCIKEYFIAVKYPCTLYFYWRTFDLFSQCWYLDSILCHILTNST